MRINVDDHDEKIAIARKKQKPFTFGQVAERFAADKKLQLIAVGLIVALLATVPSLYFYHRSQLAEQKLKGTTSTSLQTTADVIKRISRHMVLPSGEQPTLATVSDASKVRNQSFFANAANGDKVLVYAQAKKAFLYRPSIDKLIEVAPLAPNENQ